MKDLLASLRTATSAPDPSHGNTQLLAGIISHETTTDLFQSEEYARFVASMIPLCYCRESNRPCDGVLAGGICDGIKDEPLEGYNDDLDWDFNERETLKP